MTGLWVLLVAVGVAVILGVVLRRRSGRVTPTTASGPSQHLATLLSEAGVSAAADAPLLLHFSAPWCGPCVGVRHLVDQLGNELIWLRHVEVDVAQHPQLSAHLHVLSLPTVVVYDTGLQQRFRLTGPPRAAELRAALLALGPGGAIPGTTAG